MKVVLASTEVQEEKLGELTTYMYSSVFPSYFTDKEIREFMELQVLYIPHEKDERLFTLEFACKAITSLEVIIFILEMIPKKADRNYESLFNNNVKLLEQSGLFFPFVYGNFFSRLQEHSDAPISMYTEPTNEYLI